MMSYLVTFVIATSISQTSETVSYLDVQPCTHCNPCDCPTCICDTAQQITALLNDPFNVSNRIVETYVSAFDKCLKSGKALVVGVGREAPSGNWLSVSREPDGQQFIAGTVMVLVPQDGIMYVKARLGVSSQDVQNVLNSGACSNGSCGVGAYVTSYSSPGFYSTPMRGFALGSGACFGGGR